MSDTLLQQGMDLMLYGMGSVLVFLTLLVVATTLMSRFMNRYFPEPELPAPTGHTAGSGAPRGGEVDKKTLAIIEAAIEQHRARR